uniref:aldehyde dehydrogenase family protein n=1 Tax=Nocardia farcinica TaxID=37329 RepID=UPI001E3EC8C9
MLTRLTARVCAGDRADARAPFPLIEYYTVARIDELPQSRPADVSAAFATARAAQRDWAATPLRRRLAVFARAHELILTERETLADLIQIGCGKTRRMAFEESCDV